MDRSLVELAKKRHEEKERLFALVDTFAEDMKARLNQKVNEGYTGWDGDTWDVFGVLVAEAERARVEPDGATRQRRCVDVANFAMFAWYRTRERKQSDPRSPGGIGYDGAPGPGPGE